MADRNGVDAGEILREQQGLRDELEALRPQTRWLRWQLERLIAENHLSEKVRQALEGR